MKKSDWAIPELSREQLGRGIRGKYFQDFVLTAVERTEIVRRLQDHDRDPDSALSWEAVRRELLKKCK